MRRRRYGRRRTLRRFRRRLRRSGMRLSRPMRSLNVHSYVRMCSVKEIANIPTTQSARGANSFKFSDLINLSDFTNLYDMYKINLIVVKMYLKYGPTSQDRGILAPPFAPIVTTVSTPALPRIYYYVDYNDDNSPTSTNDVRENGRCVVKRLTSNGSVTIKFKPRVAASLFNSAVSSGYYQRTSPWISTANPDVPHYGLKWAVEDLPIFVDSGSSVVNIIWETKYYFQCRQSR